MASYIRSNSTNKCPPGKYGGQCQYTSKCSQETCANGGTCNPATGKCECVSWENGYPKYSEKDNCQTPLCLYDCSGNGECVNGTCECNDGWEGDACNVRKDLSKTCPTNTPNTVCSGNGYCNDMGQCVCDDTNNWSGLDCSQQIETKFKRPYSHADCPSNDKDTVCSSNGTCVNQTCVCNIASSGDDCSRGMPDRLMLSIKKHSPGNLLLIFLLLAITIYFVYIFATHWNRTKEVKDLHKHVHNGLRKIGLMRAAP